MSRSGAVAVGVLCALAVFAGPLTGYDLRMMSVASSMPPLLACVAALRSRRRPGAPRTLLGLTALAMGCNALAYVAFHVQWVVVGYPSTPSAADPLYLVGYASLLVGWLLHLRSRAGGRAHLAATLDAALVVVGPAAVVAALVVEPLLDGPQPLPLMLSAVYPLCDLALFTVLVSAVFSGALRGTRAVLWLGAAGFLLVGDAAFFALVDGGSVAEWYQAPYALAFSCFLFAVAGPGDQPGALTAEPVRGSSVHLAAISASACVPAAVLVLQGLLGSEVDWLVLGTGSLLAAVLAGLRLQSALQTSLAQAADLAQLARYDDLTGLPNRRELTLALQAAVEDPTARVVVAVLDLDHFKRVNDAGGHAAGDLLLQDATRAWQAQLPPGADLYRWGGEEFVVVLRGTAPDDAVALLERVRTSTPAPHTVSIGVAVRRTGESGATLLVRADEQVYRAKETGRDRWCGDDALVTPPASEPSQPSQPTQPSQPGPAQGQRFADDLPSRATSAG